MVTICTLKIEQQLILSFLYTINFRRFWVINKLQPGFESRQELLLKLKY